jgi:uncharacterized protein YndB with AHSA1/START domain
MESIQSNGKAVTVKKIFSRETAVGIDIQSDSSVLWALLTNASDYPRWNSTVISIEGSINAGSVIQLKSKLDPKRVFKLKVKEFHPESKLVWGDGMGQRTFTIKSIGKNLINFTMSEKIGGPIFPLFASMIPSFDQSFEQFAQDLKKEAEAISKTS